ncbi:MAG: hypothetical protein M3198_03355 [Actinomycetota bacterium]|nr:hypothetical protein [Actinomycetota bacterium]
MTRRIAAATVVMFLALLVVAAPSWAHHKSGHSQGGGKSAEHSAGKPATGGGSQGGGSTSGGGSSSGSTYTEDNDTNDNDTPNNIEDAGDNAHPSGKDKSVEHGNSGNQGNSSSDPDDDGHGPDRSNGGPDKPNGSGGVDLADQDGNNGCGNDDDFEDDNEGWCGKPKDKGKDEVAPKTEKKDKVCEKDDSMGTDVECGADVDKDEVVLGTVFSKVGAPFDLDESNPAPQVLGEKIVRTPKVDADADAEVAAQPLAREATEVEAADEETGALPFTGSSVTSFLLIGFTLIAVGLVIRKLRITQ